MNRAQFDVTTLPSFTAKAWLEKVGQPLRIYAAAVVRNLDRDLTICFSAADADFSFSLKVSRRISKKFQEKRNRVAAVCNSTDVGR